jgi:hypothetical protein
LSYITGSLESGSTSSKPESESATPLIPIHFVRLQQSIYCFLRSIYNYYPRESGAMAVGCRLISLILLFVFGFSSISVNAVNSCKCVRPNGCRISIILIVHSKAPYDPCWPSSSEWSSLNETVNGRLIRAVPPGSACYHSSPNYDERVCSDVASQWFNSSFHADDPVSIDYPIWANNSCNPIFPNGTSITGDPLAGARGCTIGEYPVYVVNATEATQVQSTLSWAAKRNIRINIKNTGHNYPGR